MFLCEPKIVDTGKPSSEKNLLQKLKKKDNLNDEPSYMLQPPELSELPTFDVIKTRKPGNTGEGVLKLSTESLLRGFEEYEGQHDQKA
jgi:hypothetical protein